MKRVNTRGIQAGQKTCLDGGYGLQPQEIPEIIAGNPKNKTQDVSIEQERGHTCFKTILSKLQSTFLSLLAFGNTNFIPKINPT